MQDKAELNEALARQRESVEEEVKILKASLAKAISRLEAIRQQEIRDNEDAAVTQLSVDRCGRACWWSRATAVVLSVFAVATLISAAIFHDAQSNVKKNGQREVSAVNALETVQPVNDNRQFDSDRKPLPQPDKKKTRFARVKASSQRQWGPSLWMPEPDAAKQHSVFDPLVKEQQKDLRTLGFDVGRVDGFEGVRTRRAIAEFCALYLAESAKPPSRNVLAAVIRNYANLARSDAGKFGIDHGVVAAIRLSSVRTGVDFSYLMKLAYAESNFDPASESVNSSATGMYQFTRDTWLNALKLHGPKYGVSDYVTQIDYYVTRGGNRRPMVRDRTVYEHLLALRKNPRLAAIMAAESTRDNRRTLARLFDREPSQADLYLTHFLGADAAIRFLRSVEQTPDTFAVELFPEAAGSNHDIFHPQVCAPRTVDEVYALFSEKFSSQRYDDLASK